MQRNITLAYFINTFKHSWFWLGIWVFYYLRFTNYAGIGLIETVMILTRIIMEIPTGALADFLGKRITPIVAFFLETIFVIGMITSSQLPQFIVSVFIGSIGGALFSGSFEALVYDSLKEDGQESKYQKVTSNLFSLQLLMLAISSIFGGIAYSHDPRLPYLLYGSFQFFALVLSLFLKEPKVDSQKFTLYLYINQNIEGTKELFRSVILKRLLWLLLPVSCLLLIGDEMLNDVLAVEFGFQSLSLSILSAATFILASFASQLSPRIKIPQTTLLIALSLVLGFTFVVSPIAGIVVGGIAYSMRYMLEAIYYNQTSEILNQNISSSKRATALSAFNLIKNLPYVFTALYIGKLMDTYSARSFALVVGVIIILASFIFYSRRQGN